MVFEDEDGHQWKRTFDALGRLTQVLEPDTSNNPTIETDYQYDALNNLTRVDQWGGPSSSSGERLRQFAYDSLSRLIASVNPEKFSSQQPARLTCSGAASGTVWSECYGYDANGNEVSHTDNRNITTTLQYDALNRVTHKLYSDGVTQPAFYLYDSPQATYVAESFPYEASGQPTNVVGRLAFAGVGASGNYSAGTSYSYDGLGRIVLQSSCTPRTCPPNGTISDQYDRQYSYDWAGNMTFAGRGYLSRMNAATPGAGYYYGGLTFAYSGSSHPLSATSDLPIDSTHPSQAIAASLQYSPLGGITNALLGNVFTQTLTYTSRGWISNRATSNSSSGAALTDTFTQDEVGNVQSVSDTQAGAFDFCYDNLNRLTQVAQPTNGTPSPCPTPAAAAASGTDYTYDNFGNLTARTAFAGSTYQGSFVPTTSNQSPSFGYDAAGNTTYDGLHNYTYDAEGRITTVDGSTQYYYDAEGHRVAVGPVGQTPTTDYLYDLNDTLVTIVGSDYRMVRSSLYGAGQHWADFTAGTGSGGGATEYRLGNEVGTLFFKGDGLGNFIESCTSSPFGEALSCSQGIDYTENHFVEKKRDSESNLDYMSARFYNSNGARFMSPDPLGGHLENPQSLNKYAYALNNPLSNTDPTGLDSYLQCQTASSTCASQTVGYDSKGNAQTALVQGVTGQNGQFTATQIGNDANGNLVDKTTGTGSYTASANGSGVQFSTNGGQSSSTGVFVNGTPQTTFQDAGFANGGALSAFNFTLTNSKLEANQTEAGYFSFGGTPDQAGAALQQAGFARGPGIEGGMEYRSRGSFLTGADAGHFIVNPNILLDPGVSVPAAGGSMHFGEHNVYGGIGGAGAILHCVSDRAGYCQ